MTPLGWLDHKTSTQTNKICEIGQNFKVDLTKFYEIFLNITSEFPQGYIEIPEHTETPEHTGIYRNTLMFFIF